MPESSNTSSEKYNLESITAYIDNELDSDKAKEVESLIETDAGIKKYYEFEKRTKSELKNRIKTTAPPAYIYTNIYSKINQNYTDKTAVKYFSEVPNTSDNTRYTPIIHNEYLKKLQYIYYFGAAFIIIFGIFITIYYYTDNNTTPQHLKKDFVGVSINVFEKVKKNEITADYKANTAKELEDILSSEAGYNCCVPELTDVILIGGTINEINGQKLVHIFYRKDEYYIYILQAPKTELLSENRLLLEKKHKQKIIDGNNWFCCEPTDSNKILIWHNEDIVSSTVSNMSKGDLDSIFKNVKK